MVHRTDRDMDMDRDMVTDMVPDKVLAHRLDMVPGLKKASELAPAPAPSMCILLTAGRKVVCCLTDNQSCFP